MDSTAAHIQRTPVNPHRANHPQAPQCAIYAMSNIFNVLKTNVINVTYVNI
jgi:hypothetical protein